ncbi:MAG: hypothetical protein M1823_000932 [Watsoniomyces obsoletus]|nr:MAG: hypothetical protein M1823_000932 [Watsoniomyces obsoletus]
MAPKDNPSVHHASYVENPGVHVNPALTSRWQQTRNDRADIACPCCRSKPNGDDLPCLKRPGGERSTSRASDDEDDVRFPKHTTFVPWTMEQAYFAVLGGFAVKSRSFWYTDHLTFTPAGMLELARVGLLPTIPPESVQDKSKADALAKVLVLLQAGWFLVQSIARIARGLPLTLLEVHTIVHIACAFGMYVIWFKKPYNVNSAQICEDESVVNMAALFALNKQRKTYDSKVSYAKTYACVQTDAIDMKQAREVHVKRSSADVIVSNHFLRANRAADRLRGRGIHFTWAICEYGEARLNAVYVVAHRSDFGILGRLEKEVQRGGDRDRHFVRTFGFSKILAILYGGAHLSAWNAHFPTEIEKWLWRGSGIALAAAPIIYEMFELLSTPDPQMVGRCQKHLRLSERSRKAVRGVSCGLSMVPAFLSVAIFTIYPLVRVYLVAESFASLRNPPARTYETVEWTDFIPHAS